MTYLGKTGYCEAGGALFLPDGNIIALWKCIPHIIDGKTGWICKPNDAEDMAAQLRKYFDSTLFHQRDGTRASIVEFAEKKYSWTNIGRQTYEVYTDLAKHP